jgi:RluA family pseudouridine synthase
MPSKDTDLVLWQDDHILLVNKPAGWYSLPDGYHQESNHLAAVLMPTYGQLWIVHRLDHDTSGIMVLARNQQSHRELCQQFEHRQVIKVYHALVSNIPDWEERVVEVPLRIDGDRQHRTTVDYHKGKFARTNVRVMEQIGSYALIEARPETGRTHQIRVHLKEIDCPIIADRLYGDGKPLYLSSFKRGYRVNPTKPERPLLDRLALHAFSLRFRHPFNNGDMYFEAPYPKDFTVALRQLYKYHYL